MDHAAGVRLHNTGSWVYESMSSTSAAPGPVLAGRRVVLDDGAARRGTLRLLQGVSGRRSRRRWRDSRREARRVDRHAGAGLELDDGLGVVGMLDDAQPRSGTSTATGAPLTAIVPAPSTTTHTAPAA